MKAYRIKGWDKHYENNRSRELRRPEWLPLPNTFDGRGYMELCDHPAGMSHYGAWCMLLAAASRMPTRGLLVTDSGHPLSVKDIARMTRGSAKAFDEALPRLIAIGWIEEVEIQDDAAHADTAAESAGNPVRLGSEDADTSQHGAGIPQPCAAKVRLNGKGNEKGIEGEENTHTGAREAPVDLPIRLRETWREILGVDGAEVANRALQAGRRIFRSPSSAQLLETWKCAASAGVLQEPPDRWPDFRQTMRADRQRERAPGSVQADAETLDLARQWDEQDRKATKANP